MKSLVRKEKEENMDINTYILMNKYSIYFGDTWWGGHPNAARLVCEGRDLARSPQFDTFKEGHVVPVLSPTDWLMTEQPLPFALFPSSHLPLHHTHTQWEKKHQSTKEINIFVFSNFLPFHYFEIPLKNK